MKLVDVRLQPIYKSLFSGTFGNSNFSQLTPKVSGFRFNIFYLGLNSASAVFFSAEKTMLAVSSSEVLKRDESDVSDCHCFLVKVTHTILCVIVWFVTSARTVTWHEWILVWAGSKKCSHHLQEKPEYQVPRGQWSKQTHDHWDRCQDKVKKVIQKQAVWCDSQYSHLFLCLRLTFSTLFLSRLGFLRSRPSALPGSFLGSQPAGKQPVRSRHLAFLFKQWLNVESSAKHWFNSTVQCCTLI